MSNNFGELFGTALLGRHRFRPLVRCERRFPRLSGWFHRHTRGAGQRRPVGGRWWPGPVAWSGDLVRFGGGGCGPSGPGSPTYATRTASPVKLLRPKRWHRTTCGSWCGSFYWLRLNDPLERHNRGKFDRGSGQCCHAERASERDRCRKPSEGVEIDFFRHEA